MRYGSRLSVHPMPTSAGQAGASFCARTQQLAARVSFTGGVIKAFPWGRDFGICYWRFDDAGVTDFAVAIDGPGEPSPVKRGSPPVPLILERLGGVVGYG
jgi:hypothetical protein